MTEKNNEIDYMPTNVFKKIYNSELIQQLNDNKVPILYKYLVLYTCSNKHEIIEHLLQNGANGNITSHTNLEAINYTIFNTIYEKYYELFVKYEHKFNYNINCWRIQGFTLQNLKKYNKQFNIDINKLLSIVDNNNNTILHLILIYDLFSKSGKKTIVRHSVNYNRLKPDVNYIIKKLDRYNIDINRLNNKNQSIALLLFISLNAIRQADLTDRSRTEIEYFVFINNINKIISYTHIPSLLTYIEQNKIEFCDTIMDKLITHNSHSNIKAAI